MRIETVPSDLARHYPPDYYGSSANRPADARAASRSPLAALGAWAADRALLLGRGRRLARWTRRWAPTSDANVRRAAAFTRRAGIHSFDDPILDVGCGWRADNLAALRKVGFRRLLGIDPFLEHDGEYEGVPLRRRRLEDETGTFQAITFHHSFEHVPDPAATLAAAARRLRPGGTVLIRTPVMGTSLWERYGTAWWELDAPRHLFVHTEASLDALARRARLTIVDVVWDSSLVEFVASDQISRDLAWREPGSWYHGAPAGFDDATIAGYRTLATELNKQGRAGRAGFYMRRSDDATAA
ncbi:MAG: class I SAM-dependent methyltransferase [Chloroflexota bacterium]